MEREPDEQRDTASGGRRVRRSERCEAAGGRASEASSMHICLLACILLISLPLCSLACMNSAARRLVVLNKLALFTPKNVIISTVRYSGYRSISRSRFLCVARLSFMSLDTRYIDHSLSLRRAFFFIANQILWLQVHCPLSFRTVAHHPSVAG